MSALSRLALSRLALAAVLAMVLPVAARAAETARVAVTLPALHSLTARLLQGVAEPELLMPKRAEAHLVDLSAAQIQTLRRADLVVWSGPELEGAVAEAGLIMPDLKNRVLTLSHHLPIMTPAEKGTDRPGKVRDLRFWLDPRLAHHAVHMLTPALVRLYPLALETILSNEAALMDEIHHSEHAVRAALGTAEGTPLHLGQGDLRYLEWRFNLAAEECPRNGFDPMGFDLTPGAGLYSRLMERAGKALAACIGRGV